MKIMLMLLMIIAIGSTDYVMCSLLTSQSNNMFEAMENDDWKATERLITENVHRLDLPNNNGKTLLHRAVEKGNESIVKLLLDMRANIEARDRHDKTSLHRAVIERNISIVKLLLDKGANIEARDRHDKTSLHRAVIEGNISIVMLLLDKRANIEARDRRDRTPLHKAVAEGTESIVKLLLDLKANIEASDSFGWTPLHKAVTSIDELIVKLLLGKGANIEAQNTDGWTPLHLAAENGWTPPYPAVEKRNESIIKLLLDKGANIEAQNTDGWTPQHLAARIRSESIVKLFLDRGANIEVPVKYGRTPLHLAASAPSVEVCELLIRKNANINEKDIFGNTGLHIAILGQCVESSWSDPDEHLGSSHVDSYKREKVLRLFLENGLSPEEKNNDGDTPLHSATKFSDSRSCRLLIQKKADIDARNSNMRSAFHLAALKIHPYILTTLLPYRPSVDLRDEFGCEPLHYACLTEDCFAAFGSLPNNLEETNLSGWNPLHIACSTNNSLAVETLLRQGVDVNGQIGKSGKTALMIACQKGYKEICILLLSDGALDKDALDNNLGGTALDWACEFEQLDICKLLLYKGFTYKRLYEKFKLLRRACRNDHVGLSKLILDNFSLWDKVDEKGNSVLHYGCMYGSKEVVEFVLRKHKAKRFMRKHKAKGLQVNIKNSGGKLAFHLAEEKNLPDVVKLFTIYGVRHIEENS